MDIRFVMLAPREYSSGGYAFNFRMVKALEEAGHSVKVFHNSTLPRRTRGSVAAGAMHLAWSILRDPGDLVIISKSYSYMIPLRLFLGITGVPVLYMVHHFEWHDRPEAGRPLRKALVKWFVGSGDLIWTNSLSTSADVAELGIPPRRTRVVPPGFDPFPVVPYRDRELPVKIITVGTVCSRKDQITLVKSCALLRDLDFELHILGDETADPVYAHRVRKLVEASGLESRVFFQGHLPVERLRGFYGNSHIMANLSLWEGYGMAVVEALQSGLPVVAVDSGAVPELIENGVQGYLVPPGDVEECASRLRELVSRSELREQLSVSAGKRAGELNRWKDTERDFVALAEETVFGGEE